MYGHTHPRNCLGVFDRFVGSVPNGLTSIYVYSFEFQHFIYKHLKKTSNKLTELKIVYFYFICQKSLVVFFYLYE